MATAQPPSYSDRYSGHTDAAMDGALWGELQNHIDLAMIYVKLPLAPFFRMRQVCKEWNRLASDRQFLERTFKPPVADRFFVISLQGMEHRLLTCDASSWSSMPLPRVKCDVSGLLIEFFDQNSDQELGRIRVFNLHTRVFHKLPPIPTTMQGPDFYEDEDVDQDEPYGPMVGMTVDTTVIPYSFRVILAHEDIGTRIYDSKSGAWTQKPSMFDYAHLWQWYPECVNDNHSLYIRVLGGPLRYFELHTYYLQEDEWIWERPEIPMQENEWIWERPDIPKMLHYHEHVPGMGLWQKRLFLFGKFGPVLAIWKIDRHLKKWIKFDFMPEHLCAWISSGSIEPNLKHIESKFCNEHVLLYSYVIGEEKVVLYNLDRKTWEKVVLPTFVRPCQQTLP